MALPPQLIISRACAIWNISEEDFFTQRAQTLEPRKRPAQRGARALAATALQFEDWSIVEISQFLGMSYTTLGPSLTSKVDPTLLDMVLAPVHVIDGVTV